MDKRKELRERLGQIADDAGDNLDRAGEYTSSKVYEVARSLNSLTVLSYDGGKAVQEVLNRYRGELVSQRESLQLVHEETWQVQKDIDYIEGLAKLFD